MGQPCGATVLGRRPSHRVGDVVPRGVRWHQPALQPCEVDQRVCPHDRVARKLSGLDGSDQAGELPQTERMGQRCRDELDDRRAVAWRGTEHEVRPLDHSRIELARREGLGVRVVQVPRRQLGT
jgi:hypothetical protein